VFCAHVPAQRFKGRRRVFKFRDPKHSVPTAKGLDRVLVKIGRDGSLRFVAGGRRAQLAGPEPGRLLLTVGLRDPAAAEGGNRCSATTAEAVQVGRKNKLKVRSP
jgi:hypothetical protein